MDNDLKFDDVLLLKSKDSNALHVAGMDKKGKVNFKELKEGENPDFLRIDRNGNMLENFFENFMRQVKNPTHFEFFRLPADGFPENAKVLQDALQHPDKPENKKLIDLHRVEPEAYLKNRQSPEQQQSPPSPKEHAINPDLVNWEKFANYGYTREMLEKTGDYLDRLLDYRKTDLLPVTLKLDGETQPLRTEGRLALRKQEDGTFSPVAHLIQKEPNLDRPYFGVNFTDEDKKNLLTTGNLGRIVEAEFKPGEKTPVLLSIDQQTNELSAYRKDRLKVPDTYKGVRLSDEQKQQLGEGKAVRIEDMTSSKGTKFSAGVQFNADKRYFELLFNTGKKQEQNQQQSPSVPKTFRKKELTDDQRKSLDEGKTVRTGELFDKQGKKYTGYITFDRETAKMSFLFPNQYAAALAAGKVIPDDRHKTQVAVNSEGKTDEATKHVKEPLKQGQTQPDEKQAEKQQEKKTEQSQKSQKSRKPKVRKGVYDKLHQAAVLIWFITVSHLLLFL
jgi:hypothetical protein